jgi:glyoxylase-like metal-dependent hydrolase (beta-lactamase superfamily II)
MFKVGEHGDVPAPEVYWMQGFGAWVRLSFYSFLVDTADGYLLVNTGLPKDLTDRNNFLKKWANDDRCKFTVSEDQKIENALKKAGVGPADVAHVVVTPVQDYTVGRLDLFRNAQLYFSMRGWFEDVVTPGKSAFISRDVFLPKYVRQFLFEDAWDRIRLVEDQEIVEGVSVRWTGGHHRSSMSVLLQTKDGIISITDSAFTWKNLEENIPIGIAEDVGECLGAYSYLKMVSKSIIPAYDPDNVVRYNRYLLR